MIKNTILLTILLAFGTAADALQFPTQGWVIGLDLGGADVSFDNKPHDRGPLVGGRIGYGFNKTFTLYASAYEADINTPSFNMFDKVTFGHADFGFRAHLTRSRRWIPYGDIAMTFRPVSDVLKDGKRSTFDFSSLPSFSLGGGLAIFLSDSWALDVNAKFSNSLFKDVEIDNLANSGKIDHVHIYHDIPVESARLTIGISWWP